MLADPFASEVLAVDPQRRGAILSIMAAALAAADPRLAVERRLTRQGDRLQIGDHSYQLSAFQHIYMLAMGKAASPMAEAAGRTLGGRLTRGILVTKYGHGPTPGQLPPQITVLEAGHPVPDQAGEAAGRAVAQLAGQATGRDLVLCLISGGGSALLTLPADGLTLADLQATTDALLRCGATIHQINTLRKHLSAVKGGQLARLISPATLASLVLSDVVGSPLDVIASGPTVPDSATWADAWHIVDRHRLADTLPAAVIDRLRSGLAGQVADTPKEGDPAFARAQTLVVADNALAAGAAEVKARELGFEAVVLTTFLEGEARHVAQLAVALGREVVARGRPVAPPACLILGGETTVTLRNHGQGGRNQELALAAALALDHLPEGGRIVVASLATDGSDGPTDSAGGLVDGQTVARGRALGLDATTHLANHDAYPYLQAVGDLLVTGPTQTNVNDLILVFVFPEA